MTHLSPDPFIPAQPLSETLPAIIDQLPPDSDHPPQIQFNRARQSAFLQRLADSGEVRVAARASNVSHQTVYRLRRSCPTFRAGWDAALLIARERAEEALATRALHGVEEEVFYHGEVVAKRRRYSDRLLLAHLGRLDRLAEREDVAALAGVFDDVLEAFERAGENGAGEGEAVELPDAARVPAEAGSSGGCAQTGEAPAFAGAQGGKGTSPEPCNIRSMSPDQTPRDQASAEEELEDAPEPCPDCGGACAAPDAKLTEVDCMWLGHRLTRMEAARPRHAEPPCRLYAEGFDTGDIEWEQLLAFEAGAERWWEVLPEAPAGVGDGARLGQGLGERDTVR